MDFNFEIGAQHTGTSFSPLLITEANKYPVVYLESVEFVVPTGKNQKGEDKKPYLQFTFVDAKDKMRKFTHSYFAIEKQLGTMSVEKQFENFASRIRHIFDTFGGDGSSLNIDGNNRSIGSIVEGEKSWNSFLKQIATDFNNYKSKPVFKNEKGESIAIWIKLIVYDGEYTLPLFGNVIDRYESTRATRLYHKADEQYIITAKPKTTNPNPQQNGGGYNANTTVSNDLPANF